MARIQDTQRVVHTGATPPGTGQDETLGYEINSLFRDTAGGETYVCVDNAAGAAVWENITNASPPLTLQREDTTTGATTITGTPHVFTGFFTGTPPAASEVTISINGNEVRPSAVTVSGSNLEINTTTSGQPIAPNSYILAKWYA